MLENFQFALKAVLPIALTMLAGYIIRRSGLISEDYFRMGDKLLFNIFLPCSMFCSFYTIDLSQDVNLGFLLYVALGTLILIGLGWLSGKLLIKDSFDRPVCIMETFRANTAFIGLPLAAALGGPSGTIAMATTLIVATPIFNIMTVIVLSENEKESSVSSKEILKGILKNPLLISCFVGIAAVLIRQLIPTNAGGEPVWTLQRNLPSVYSVISSLGAISSTLALVDAGGLISLDFEKSNPGSLAFGCIWRMLLAPLFFVVGAAVLQKADVLNFTPGQFAALLAHFGGPVSVSGVAMAAEMKCNANLARQFVLFTSLLLIITLPVFVVILMSFGVL